MSYCLKRVWDNGDMTDCGNPGVGTTRLCSKHLSERITILHAQIAAKRAETELLEQELGILESQRSDEVERALR
jgi:hypothetical protein